LRLVNFYSAVNNGETFSSLEDLNRKFHVWLIKRNNTLHRSTQKTPKELLAKEHLIILPQNTYPPKRDVSTVSISKTAFVDFDTNKYSVPACYAQQPADIAAYPDKIEVYVRDKKVATHQRSFKRKENIENPLHAEKLLQQTPNFKMQRVLQLFQNMNESINLFLEHQQDDDTRMQAAYQLFQLHKTHSKIILTSAIRQLNQMGCYQIKALRSLLNLPQESQQTDPLWPQNNHLLNLNYEQRRLEDYDPN